MYNWKSSVYLWRNRIKKLHQCLLHFKETNWKISFINYVFHLQRKLSQSQMKEVIKCTFCCNSKGNEPVSLGVGGGIDFNISGRKYHRLKHIAERELVRDNDINIMTSGANHFTLVVSVRPSAVIGAARMPCCHSHWEIHYIKRT